MTKGSIKIFSPATVANVSCGYDVLGFCLDSVGDEMVIRKCASKGISITKIENYELPFEAKKNVAGVAAVDDRMTVENPEPEAVFYEVKRGDSLSKIAKEKLSHE